MKLKFILSTFNLDPSSYYSLSDIPYGVGDRVMFTSHAKRMLDDTDDKPHKIVSFRTSLASGHYIADVDHLENTYDCAWLSPVWGCKKL